jgi:Na+/proline symporter
MLLIIILIFAFTAYATSATLGSPGAVFDLLVKAAADHPVDGNAGGSYLTMKSQQGGRLLVAFNWNLVLCAKRDFVLRGLSPISIPPFLEDGHKTLL